MKKILFYFEPENDAFKEAYVYAVKFARNLGAQLIMLNTFNFEVDNDITEEKYKLLVKQNWLKAYKEVIHLNNYFIENHARIDTELIVKFDHRFLFGNRYSEISSIIEKEEIDLMVLPTSVKTEKAQANNELIKKYLFEKNKTSLLIVPRQVNYQPLKNIVFAVDFKKINSCQINLNNILRYAKAFNASIHFVHFTPKGKEFKPADVLGYEVLQKITANNSNHKLKNIQGENLLDALNEYNEKNNVRFLAVVKHHQSVLDSMFHKSFSNQAAFHSNVPVLIMKES